MRGPDSSLDGPLSLPITRFREGHSPPFRDVLASCLVLSWLSAWVLRRYGWKVGSSLVFGVLIVGLLIASSQHYDPSCFVIYLVRYVSTTTSCSIPSSACALPPPYERVASHPYGLRPRVTPIRSYGPVPRPTPVRPANNIPARRPGFVQRGVASMPVIRNVPFLSDSVRPVPSMPATRAAHVQRVVDSMPSPVSNSFRFGGRGGPVMSANIRDPRFLMGNQSGIRADSANPFLSPVYNPNARDTPMYPPSPVFDRVIRHPSPFPFPPDWSVFFRDAESSQGSSAGRRMDLDIPLVDRIGPQASGSSDVSLRANSAIVVPPAPRPRNMSTPPSSPRNPPGYVPSPRAATWGQRRRSESSTPGPGPTSARDSSAASVAEHAEIVTYHTTTKITNFTQSKNAH
ncbi:hypothetical protein PSHT_13982 [Puccinia striiformis]|uniref:Uncharacterized protein n=1 Tax=Puccinia striiformis TaxID=27350 RepID=A0A2S4UMZ0_9BASI|nr:hypothetical protein PSHT_13982 [Puccinia striiformis]